MRVNECHENDDKYGRIDTGGHCMFYNIHLK